MDIITLLQAGILGVLEGITEFIPVSSTGHLILAVDLLGFKGPSGKVFEVAIQLGAILSICWHYRAKCWQLATSFHRDASSRHVVLALLMAFLPAAMIGFVAHDFIKTVLFSPMVVVVSLIVGGVVILWLSYWHKTNAIYESMEQITYRRALYIGFFQCVAMIPGVSRSGATIIGAVLMGVERKTAMEFSFFLAMPTMLGATVLDLTKNYHSIQPQDWMLMGVGFMAAFISGLIVVKTVLGFISRYGFAPFGWYRIIVGLLMAWMLF